MLILHTFENNYDEDHTYRQFIQRGPNPLDAVGLGEFITIRQFLEELRNELCLDDDPGPDDYWNEDPEFDGPRTTHNADLVALIDAGNIQGFLTLAQELAVKTSEPKVAHACQTHFGEWEWDTVDVEAIKTLRETVENVWASDKEFPFSDWQHEVANGDVTTGYWEWVENQRDQAAGAQ